MTKEQRAAYPREWRRKNPEKNKAINDKVYAKFKAAKTDAVRARLAEYASEWRDKNPDKARATYEKQKAWREANLEAASIKHNAWVAANKESVLAFASKCRAKNRAKNRAKYRERRLLKYHTDPEYRKKRLRASVISEATRRSRKKHAMPCWVDRNAISDIYREAARITEATGIKHHVDHIWPLQGRCFSGLHTPWNLRIITAAENLAKHNNAPEGSAPPHT